MSRKRLLATNLFLTLLFCTCSPPLMAADESNRWTPDDLLLAERVGDYRVSPRGEWLVWVKVQMDKEKGRPFSNLMLTSLEGDREIQLTRGRYSNRSPRWSPDGKRIAFLSARPDPEKEREEDEHTAVWILDLAGGEPWRVTEIDRDVSDFEWKDDFFY